MSRNGTDPGLPPAAPRRAPRPAWPVRLVVGCAEQAVSRRWLALGFLLVAFGLTQAGWLRPPLGPDVRSYHLPLGVGPGAPPPETILAGPRRMVPHNAGVPLMALIGVGAAAVLLWPRCFVLVAGLLLGAAVAANAAVALNHPALIELLDHEYEQRQQVVNTLLQANENAVVGPGNARVNGLFCTPTEGDQRADLARGWAYLLYGRWLVVWAAAGVVLGGRGLLKWRLAHLALWMVLGAGLAGAACHRRLAGEYYWNKAKLLEARGSFAPARAALDAAAAWCPQLDRLERTWLLAGKLDFRTGRSSPRERFFRAYQIARDKERPRAVAHLQDLPWLIGTSQTFHASPVTPPPGFDLTGNPTDLSETLGSGQGLSAPQGPYLSTYQLGQATGPWRAIAVMQDLLTDEGRDHPAVRQQAARLLTDAGLRRYMQAPVYGDGGTQDFLQDQHLVAAETLWRRAHEVAPGKRDCAFYLGTVRARLDRRRPDLAEAEYGPVLAYLADRALEADILATLGEAYLEAHQPSDARQRYARSFDLFSLPKVINYRAQKGLGGL